MKILLLSHGNLASEMKETVQMILGKTENVDTYSLQVGEDTNAYENEIRSYVTNHQKEGVLIFTDLLGGTPFITSAKVYDSLLEENKDKVRIITGMNLPMLLEVINSVNESSNEEDLSVMAIEAGTRGIVDFIEKRKGNR